MDYKSIYDKLFREDPTYASHERDELRYQFALAQVGDTERHVDVGAGRGLFLSMLRERNKNAMLYSADLDDWSANNPGAYIECDLSTAIGRGRLRAKGPFESLTCLDVLEHLEERWIPFVLCTFAEASIRTVLTVANHAAVRGGTELHLTQRSKPWWDKQILNFFKVKHSKTEHNGRLYCYSLVSRIDNQGG